MHAIPMFAEPSVRMREWGIAVLRLVVGLTFLLHGWQKLFQFGLAGTTGYFAQVGAPLPAVTAPAVSILELVGGAALLVGLLTRLFAALLALDMLGAFALVHLPAGFFLPNGFEFVLLLLAGCIALILNGPGAFAVDNLIARRLPGAALDARAT
jgi:putative oxidoreductase